VTQPESDFQDSLQKAMLLTSKCDWDNPQYAYAGGQAILVKLDQLWGGKLDLVDEAP
jgi:hypothetical protein